MVRTFLPGIQRTELTWKVVTGGKTFIQKVHVDDAHVAPGCLLREENYVECLGYLRWPAYNTSILKAEGVTGGDHAGLSSDVGF